MSVSSPRLRMTGPKLPPTQGQVLTRILTALVLVTNPITSAITVVIVLGLGSLLRPRIRGRHILLVGIAATGGGILAGWSTVYVRPWREIAGFLHTQILQTVSSGQLPTLAPGDTFAAGTIRGWLTGQIPFAICLALVAAGIYLTWRDRYRQTWKRGAPPKPASARAIEHAKTVMDKKLEQAAPVRTPDELAIPLGVETLGAKPVTVPATSFRMHSVVIGPTGLGKTEVLKRIIWAMTAQTAARGLRIPVLVVDMKGEPALARWMETTARDLGRPFYKITTDPDTATTGYVALAGRRPDEIADMVYEMTFAGDPSINQHYATLSRRLLQVASHVLVDLTRAGARNVHTGRAWQTNLPDLTSLLSLTELRLAMADTTAAVSARITRYLADVDDSGIKDDIGDIRDRLAIITETAMGEILARPGLVLRDAIEEGAFVCFSLDAAASPETARVMGRLAVQDISATFGTLAGTPWARSGLCPIVLDEFSALATPKVADLFARVRSAGGAVILSTQDLDGDLSAVSPQFASTVRTNANVWLVLRQTRGEMAESIAGDIGTAKTWKETVQIEDDWDVLGGLHAASGVGSLREVDEFIIHPNEIRSLAQGAAILMVKVPAGSLHHDTAATQIRRLHISQAPTPTVPAPAAHQQDVFRPGQTTPAARSRHRAGVPVSFATDLAGEDYVAMPVPEPPDDNA